VKTGRGDISDHIYSFGKGFVNPRFMQLERIKKIKLVISEEVNKTQSTPVSSRS
jgi:hypothetical protein